MHPTDAAVASLNWPSKHDAKFEHFAKCLKANSHTASSLVYPINLPTRLPEDPKELIAKAIQGIAHPTGKEPVLSAYTVSKLADRILIDLKVEWKGGIVGNSYVTSVAWEIGEKGHIGAKVTIDSAMTAVDPKNKEMLDDYFRTKVYPTFFADMGS